MTDATISSDQKRHAELESWCSGWKRPPLWLRLLGFSRSFYDHGDRSYPLRWGSLSLAPAGFAFRIGAFSNAHLNIAWGLGQAFIHLPLLDRALTTGPSTLDNPAYGFSGDQNALHLSWGCRTRIIWSPFGREVLHRQWLAANGSWKDGRLPHEGAEVEVQPWSTTHPYHYMLDSGEVQSVTARVRRLRSTLGYRCFGGPRLRAFLQRLAPKKAVHTIDIEFSDELGARRGSWKGGCVGCSYEMKPGETPVQTLMRMQRERRFR